MKTQRNTETEREVWGYHTQPLWGCDSTSCFACWNIKAVARYEQSSQINPITQLKSLKPGTHLTSLWQETGNAPGTTHFCTVYIAHQWYTAMPLQLYTYLFLNNYLSLTLNYSLSMQFKPHLNLPALFEVSSLCFWFIPSQIFLVKKSPMPALFLI